MVEGESAHGKATQTEEPAHRANPAHQLGREDPLPDRGGEHVPHHRVAHVHRQGDRDGDELRRNHTGALYAVVGILALILLQGLVYFLVIGGLILWPAVRSLRDDLVSGRWAERNRDLVALDAAELGLRLLVT